VGGIATPLKNGYEEPSGSSQAAVHEWYLNTPENELHGYTVHQ